MTDKEMCDDLAWLYQSFVVSRKMLLRNKLLAVCISNTDTTMSYLARITELKDQFTNIGTEVEDKESMPIVLNEFYSILENLCLRFLCS
jgi:hypothetical protein